MSTNDLSVLEGWIVDLRRMPGALPALAREAAEDVRADLTRTLSAGTAPDGTPWAQRKEGGRAYANAASKLEITVMGTSIQGSIIGPEVWGARGARGPVRQMLPSEATPRMIAAFRSRVAAFWRKHFSR